MDLYGSIMISSVLLPTPNNSELSVCFFLIAAEHRADICIELSIITRKLHSQVEIATSEPIILCVKLGLSFPMRITLHLSTSDFTCDFITLLLSARGVFL